MRSCRKGHEGADYTIQASLQIALAGVVGALSGVFASAAGYDFLYMLCALFGGLSFVLTWNYVRQVKVESA